MEKEKILFKEKFRIPSARLKNYDYSRPGCYFITICTKNRKYFFGKIKNGKIFLSEIGKIVENCWLKIPKHFKNVEIDEFIIMPNHVHGIITIVETRHDVETRHRLVST